MFQNWEEYFLMIGSSAGALIGLMFVVVTLTAGRDRNEVERGKHLYTSPIVWHFAVILALSGAAIAPTMVPKLFALVSGGLGVLGFAMCVRRAAEIVRRPGAIGTAGFDFVWYGIVPAFAYAGLAGAALAVFEGNRWGASLLAADLMALLLVSIHAAWDLVTFLAPGVAESGEPKR